MSGESDNDGGSGRLSKAIPGVSAAVAITLCVLAVQATWNMSNGLSSLRLETQKAIGESATSIAAQSEALKLQIQELRFRIDSQGDAIKEIRDSQKSHPATR